MISIFLLIQICSASYVSCKRDTARIPSLTSAVHRCWRAPDAAAFNEYLPPARRSAANPPRLRSHDGRQAHDHFISPGLLAYYASSVTSLSIIVIILLNVRSFQHLNAVVEGLLPRSALTRETFRGVWITSLWRCCILSLFAATSPRRAASCILSCVT